MKSVQIRNHSLTALIILSLFLFIMVSYTKVHARTNGAGGVGSKFVQQNTESEDTIGKEKVKLQALYAGAGFGFGRKGTPTGWSVTTLLSNNWGMSFNYKHRALLASNIPDDYAPSGGTSTISPYSNSNSGGSSTKRLPSELYNLYSLMMVREGLTESRGVRYGIEVGPSWVWARTSTFVPAAVIVSRSLFGTSKTSNYSEEHHYRQAPGVSIRAKLEFPFTDFMGLELALMGNINKLRPFAGIELYLTLGMVRKLQAEYSLNP